MRLYFSCKIVYLVNYVFSVPGIKEKRIVLLSRNLCQDPLENYFGYQRQCDGTSDNPNALEYGKNTEALRVVNTLCRGPVRGNCRGEVQRKLQFRQHHTSDKKKHKKIKKADLVSSIFTIIIMQNIIIDPKN